MVTLGHCSGNPGLIFQVPRYGLSDPLGKARARMPAKFRFEPGCIHGITVVMPRPVGDKLDQRAGGSTVCPGKKFIDGVANRFHNLQVCFFRVCSNVVGTARFCVLQNGPTWVPSP